MKVLICGGRDLDSKQVCKWLETKFLSCFPRAREIIHGGAEGGDHGAALFCRRNGFPETMYPAQWKLYGDGAGPIRNQQMLDESKPDIVLAFPGGDGTDDMVRRSKSAGFVVYEIWMDELNSV